MTRWVAVCAGAAVVISVAAAAQADEMKQTMQELYSYVVITDLCLDVHPELKSRGLQAFADTLAPQAEAARAYVQRYPDPVYDAGLKRHHFGISDQDLDIACDKLAAAGRVGKMP